MDRNHYRMCSDNYLIETVLYAPDAELAIVLAERLVEVQAEFNEKIEAYIDKIEDLEREINELTEETYIEKEQQNV